MVCIYCSGSTKVTNSRPQKRLMQVWRRRQCVDCGAVFTSIEAASLSGSLVVQGTDGRVAPFNRDKLFVSVLRAVGHRQDALADASALTATIISKLLRSTTEAAVAPGDITAHTLATLKHFDTAAMVQYQAYHKN